jgi:hypothetical protein
MARRRRPALAEIRVILHRDDDHLQGVKGFLGISRQEFEEEFIWAEEIVHDAMLLEMGGRGTREDFFLLMYRMKKGPTYQDMVPIFRVKPAPINTACRRWVLGIVAADVHKIINTPLEQVWKDLKKFDGFNDIRVAIDATEIPI